MKRWLPYAAGATLVVVAATWWWRGRAPAAVAAPRPTAGEKVWVPLSHPVQVEVLNASGIPNVARVATIQLRAGGLDVVYFGSAGGDSSRRAVTRVLKRGADTTGLGRILEIVGTAVVEDAPPENRWVAFSVVLGKDYHPERKHP